MFESRVSVASAGQAIAIVQARCDRCDWGITGREGAALTVTLDDKYSQHLILPRGDGVAEYRLSLGRLDPGAHRLQIGVDEHWTPRTVSARIDAARIEVPENPLDQLALAHAPILHPRPDALNRFTDIPLLAWYESNRVDSATHLRYGIVFSNEDGGTPTDRLMATWGRPTDIEYVYWLDVDGSGAIHSAGFEGPGHQMRSFTGDREDRHPRLWVATKNNMIEERGETTVRFRPAPARVDLSGVSREVVMDHAPWTYAVSAKEIAREGKLLATARPGSGTIPDPRRFVYVEACAELTNAALAFAVTTDGDTSVARWYSSDADRADFRIARSGCFRGAIALPASIDADRLTHLRVSASSRPSSKDAAAADTFRVRLTRVNKVFTLTDQYVPQPMRISWKGTETLRPEQPVWTTRVR